MERTSFASSLRSSDRNGKDGSVDLVRSFHFLPLISLTLSVSQDTLVSDAHTLGPDIIEATKYAEDMSAEEVDEVIDYILEEVKIFIPRVERHND